MQDFQTYDAFQAAVSRAYLKNHQVHRYRMKKIDDLDDNKIVQVCHWFCEENNLVQDYALFLDRALNLQNGKSYLGKTIKVTIDRPLGSRHPQHKDLVYPVNYGYFEALCAPDGAPQDVYVLGVYEPVSFFEGKVIALIHRLDDVEDKWVVASESFHFSEEDIREATQFQEQFFHSEIIL